MPTAFNQEKKKTFTISLKIIFLIQLFSCISPPAAKLYFHLKKNIYIAVITCWELAAVFSNNKKVRLESPQLLLLYFWAKCAFYFTYIHKKNTKQELNYHRRRIKNRIWALHSQSVLLLQGIYNQLLSQHPISSPDVHLFLHLILVTLMPEPEIRERENENNCYASLPWRTSWGVRGDKEGPTLWMKIMEGASCT